MVYILLGEGFEETEAIATCDVLRRADIKVSLVSAHGKGTVVGAHGVTVTAEAYAGDIIPTKDDMVVVPGGMQGVASLKESKVAMELIKNVNNVGGKLAAICAGPSVLAEAGLLNNVDITCYPGCEDMMGDAICHTEKLSLVDGSVITGRGPGASFEFALTIVECIKGKNTAKEVREGLLL